MLPRAALFKLAAFGIILNVWGKNAVLKTSLTLVLELTASDFNLKKVTVIAIKVDKKNQSVKIGCS